MVSTITHSSCVIPAKAGIQAWILNQVQDDTTFGSVNRILAIGNLLKIVNCKLIIANGVRCG